MAPRQIITANDPKVSPSPFCTDTVILFSGIPKHKPAAIETIRKAKKGFILAQLTKRMSSTIQKSITNIVLHSGSL
jgi:hypothetical protein